MRQYSVEELKAALVEHDGGVLKAGGHQAGGRQFCGMEFAAFLAGEKWTDSPACVHPVIGAYFRKANDTGWGSDEARTEALLPLLAAAMGTADLPISIVNIATATVNKVLPSMLRAVAAMPGMPAAHVVKLAQCADTCEKASARDAANYASDAASNASDAANYAANYSSDAASNAANYANYAASYAASKFDARKVSIDLVLVEIARARSEVDART